MNRRKRTAGAAALETAIQLIEPVATAASQGKKNGASESLLESKGNIEAKDDNKNRLYSVHFSFFFFFIITVCPIYTIAGNEKETFFDIQNTQNVSHTLDEYLRPFFLFVAFYFIDLRCNVILSESKTLFFSVILTVPRKNLIQSEE